MPGWLGLAAPLLGCAVAAAGVPLGMADEFLQTACFFALCAVCFRGVGAAARAMAWAPLRWLGNMSYSYYLVHGIVVRVAFVALGRVLPDGMPPWAFWALLAPLFAATLAAGAVLFIAVEKPVSLQPQVPRMEGGDTFLPLRPEEGWGEGSGGRGSVPAETSSANAKAGACGLPHPGPFPEEEGKGYGSSLPGFMMPCGSSAALMRRMVSSSAPPRQPGIM